uniref:BMP family ABC transporter substrate-binding protein n=1 Tax=Clostridium sp. NkU-1 TaxID=1095009 RepID=UPI000B1097CB
MKKIISGFLAAVMCLGLVGCAANPAKESGETKNGKAPEASTKLEEAEASGQSGTSAKKAILIVNGNLGDLGFFDSANRGMQRLKNELGVDIRVIETGDDESKWEPALADASDEDADWIIAVSPSMVEPIQKLAPEYPEKKIYSHRQPGGL